MVTKRSPRLGPLMCAALLTAITGCNSPDPFMPDRDEAGLYMILIPADDDLARRQSENGDLHGLLVRTGTPLSTSFLRPESVLMTRVGDGLRLGWRILDMEGEAVQFTYSAGDLSEGNLLLPREGGPTGAGAESIRAGDRFDLVVAVDGTEIHGTTRVPVRPEIRVSETEGRTVFSWSPVPGAAAYEASFQGVDGTYDGLPLGPDTLFVLDRPVREGDRLWVYAYDQNLATYVLDETVGRSGLDTGFGVFGAMVSTDSTF